MTGKEKHFRSVAELFRQLTPGEEPPAEVEIPGSNGKVIKVSNPAFARWLAIRDFCMTALAASEGVRPNTTDGVAVWDWYLLAYLLAKRFVPFFSARPGAKPTLSFKVRIEAQFELLALVEAIKIDRKQKGESVTDSTALTLLLRSKRLPEHYKAKKKTPGVPTLRKDLTFARARQRASDAAFRDLSKTFPGDTQSPAHRVQLPKKR